MPLDNVHYSQWHKRPGESQMISTIHPGLHTELTEVVRAAVKAHLNTINAYNLVYSEGPARNNKETISASVGEGPADHFRIIVEYQDE